MISMARILGAPDKRAGRQQGRQDIDGRTIFAQLAFNQADQVHDMGETFDMAEILDLNGAETADPSDIVAGQVDQHRMFGQFLGIGQQIGSQGIILVGCCTAAAGAGDRAGFDRPAGQAGPAFPARRRPGRLPGSADRTGKARG